MSAEEKETEQTPEPRAAQPFGWLYVVLGVSVVTFLLEYTVAQYANSGALQADCGHLFMDIVLYSQVVIAEHLKNVTFVKRNPRLVALLDLLGGSIAFFLLVVNSYCVVKKATARLESPGQKLHPAVSEESAAPHGFLSWVWKSFFHDHDHDKVDVNERLVFAFCAGSLPINIAIACYGYSFVQTNTDSWLESIHHYMHPGCQTIHGAGGGAGAGLTSAFARQCKVNDCADCVVRKTPRGLTDGTYASGSSRRPTFNLVTVWVHISTDIMKDAVLCVAALIMAFNTMKKNSIDSVTAMIIVALIAIGAVWMLPALWNTLTIVYYGGDEGYKGEGQDEEQSLLINGSANLGSGESSLDHDMIRSREGRRRESRSPAGRESRRQKETA